MVLDIGGVDMKSKSLIIRFVLIYLVVIITFLGLGGWILYGSIEAYFKKDAFESLEYASKTNRFYAGSGFFTIAHKDPGPVDQDLKTANRGVHYAYMLDDSAEPVNVSRFKGPALAEGYVEFAELILDDVESYTMDKHYSDIYQGKNIYYILRHESTIDREGKAFSYYVLAFMTDAHSNDLTTELFARFAIVLFFLVAIVTLIGFYMLNTFRKKFTSLDVELTKISKRQWEDPIDIEGEDEFSGVHKRLEEVRKELLFYDTEMKHQFHSVSHEFKTPIMIIRGYVDATLNGKYPKGTLEASLKVIDEEMQKLNEMVNKVLYFNKIDYMSKNQESETLDLKDIFIERLRYYEPLREDVEWSISGEDIKVRGAKEQWYTIVNNLLENQIRYAKSKVIIKLDKTIRIANDGPEILEDHLDKVFNAFFKGPKGQSGLGLAIVKKNLEVNGYEVEVENVSPGVLFKIAVTNSSDRNTIN